MYHHKIQFYDKISKLGHKGQISRSHSEIFLHTNFKGKKLDAMSSAGFPDALVF